MYENKKVFILGFARSGYEVAKLLSKYNNEIVLNDFNKEQNKDQIKELEDLGIKIVLGSHPDDLFDDSFDVMIKNPGIHFDHKYVIYAEKHNIPIVTELEVAYHFLPKGVKIVGITGTNGKTTTTTITYNILKNFFGDKVHLAGNIGIAFSGIIKDIKENDIVVMEIGVPQLHDMYDFKCDISVLTNIYEAHLDMFGTREFYNQTKHKIFNHTTKENIAIVNHGNSDAMMVADNISATTKYFSSIDTNSLCYLKENKIYYDGCEIIDVSNILIKGVHNYENCMCAIMIAKEFGVLDEVIVKTLSEFKGVEHRIEFVKEINHRQFYNDSKATNIKATQIALSSFNSSLILLLGGLERNQDFLELKDYLKYTKLVIAYGECKNRIEESMKSLNINCISCDVLKEAIMIAYDNSETGDIILLSPASASWDQYKSFEIRGEKFKNIVKGLGV